MLMIMHDKYILVVKGTWFDMPAVLKQRKYTDIFMFRQHYSSRSGLTHWGRVTHICVNKLTIIGSDNGLSPGRRQAIIWTNAGILSMRTIETNVSEILIQINKFWFKKMYLKVSSGKWRPFCVGLKMLTRYDEWRLQCVAWGRGCTDTLVNHAE